MGELWDHCDLFDWIDLDDAGERNLVLCLGNATFVFDTRAQVSLRRVRRLPVPDTILARNEGTYPLMP